MQRQRRYLLCQTLGWSAHALINVGLSALYGGASWTSILALVLADSSAGATSHFLRAWIQRRGWLPLPLLRIFPRLLLASLVCGCTISAFGSATSVWIFHYNRLPSWNWINLLPIIFVWSVTIFLWAMIYCGVHYFEGYRNSQLEQLRLQVIVKDSELRSLLAQLNPHFMFNCLNSLRALIVEDPPRAQNMVDELSSILRYSLQSGRLDTVPLQDEIAAINAYLRLELIRFEDRLQVSMEIDPASLNVPIPPMLLQTLIENSVKHGIAQLAQGGEIRVTSRMHPESLRIQVINTGQLRAAGNSTQIGIENARERLRLIYGGAASLVLLNLNASSVLAEVCLPLKKAVA